MFFIYVRRNIHICIFIYNTRVSFNTYTRKKSPRSVFFFSFAIIPLILFFCSASPMSMCANIYMYECIFLCICNKRNFCLRLGGFFCSFSLLKVGNVLAVVLGRGAWRMYEGCHTIGDVCARSIAHGALKREKREKNIKSRRKKNTCVWSIQKCIMQGFVFFSRYITREVADCRMDKKRKKAMSFLLFSTASNIYVSAFFHDKGTDIVSGMRKTEVRCWRERSFFFFFSESS